MKPMAFAVLLTIALLGSQAHAAPCNQQGVTTSTFQFMDASGTQWQQTRTDTWTLTYVQVSGTSPAVTPVPVPLPPVTPVPPITPPPAPVPVPGPSPLPTSLIDGLRDAHRDWLPSNGATVHGGDSIDIEGAGFGTTVGTVIFSNGALPFQILYWGPLEIAVVAPKVSAVTVGSLVVTPASGSPATSDMLALSP